MKLFIVIHSTGCRLNCNRNFFVVFRKFCIFFHFNSKCLWAFDSKVVRLPDSSSKGTGSLYSRTLSNQIFDFELCVASGAFFVTLLSASCISLDSGQPTISYCFYAIKKCMLLEFFQQVLDASCSIRVYHSNRSHEIQFTQYLDPFKVVLQSNAIPLIILYLFCVQTVHTSFSFNSLNAKKADKG